VNPADLNHSVVAVKPDGTIAAVRDCDTLDEAKAVAKRMRELHNDWTIRIEGRPGETKTDFPVVESDPPSR
jgi:hypothetical protein